MSARPVAWTDPMLAALQDMRGRRLPLRVCAEKIGVDERIATRKARELGLAQRHNQGRRPGYTLTRPTAAGAPAWRQDGDG